MKHIFLVIIALSLSACAGNYTYEPRHNTDGNLPSRVVVKKVTPPPSLKAEKTTKQEKITKEEAKNLFTSDSLKASPELASEVKTIESSFSGTIASRVTALEDAVTELGYGILVITRFQSAKSSIPEKGKKELAKLDLKNVKILRISGYASYGGNDRDNLKFSFKRAYEVNKTLTEAGADTKSTRLFAKGETRRFGKNRIDNQAVVVIYK